MANIRTLLTSCKGVSYRATFTNSIKHDYYGTTEEAHCFIERKEKGGHWVVVDETWGRDRWINRPWYRYQYQNAMRDAISNLQTKQLNRVIDSIKIANGKKNTTKSMKEQARKDAYYRLLGRFYKALEHDDLETERKQQKRFEKWQKDYKSLSDKTKTILANSGVSVSSMEQGEELMKSAKLMDALFSIMK